MTPTTPYNPAGYAGSQSDQYNAIVAQYNQMYQQHNSPNFQAYDPSGFVGYSGNAATYREQWQPLQESRYANQNPAQPFQSTVPVRDLSSNAPTRAENLGYNQYDIRALEQVQNRPGFNQTLGDSYTRGVIAANERMRDLGFDVASNDVMTGRALEAQRQAAFRTPGYTDDRYYSGELQKYVQNKVEVSSAYHHIGMQGDVPIPANRWEYQGDLAVELLKGQPRKDSEFFSPVSGEMAPYLPQYKGRGEGIQDYAWRQAQQGEKAGPVSFGPGLEKLFSAEGQYGPYGVLWGAGTVATPEERAAGLGGVGPAQVNPSYGGMQFASIQKMGPAQLPAEGGNNMNLPEGYGTFGVMAANEGVNGVEASRSDFAGLPVPFSSAGKTQPLGVQVTDWFGGAERQASQLLWGGDAPKITTEQIKQEANFMGVIPGALPFAMALKTPVVQDYAASYLKGEYEGAVNKPIQAGVSFGAGLVMGGLFRGGEAVYGIGRSGIAPSVISEGGGWRGAEIGGNAIMNYGPKILGGLYAIDVTGRSTQLGSDLSPASAERFGGIVSTEARPMFFGGLVGYAAPGAVYNSARVSDMGYKSAIQEGATTGRFDYYVRQPATRPIEMAKLDYASFKQEGGSGVFDYAAERAGLNIAPASEPVTLKYNPAQTGEFAEAAYGKQGTVFDYFTKGTYEKPVTLKYEPAQTGEISELAYGKQKTAFETIFDAANKATMKGSQVESTRPFFTEKTSNALSGRAYSQETLGMRIDAFRQENPNIGRDVKTWVRNPAKEISDYNKMVDFNKDFKGSESSGASGSTTGKGSPFGSAPSGRIGTKVVGGRTVGGLAPEPSMRSQGIPERTSAPGKLGFAESRSTDFRGNPQSSRMKPMGKQAAGQLSIMREELPVVEGMNTGRISQQQQRMPMFPFQAQRQGSAIEAEFDVVQARKQPREVMFEQQMPDISSLVGVTTARSQMQDVTQRQRQEQTTVMMSDVGRITRQSVSQERQSLLDRMMGVSTERIPDRATRTERGSTTIPRVAFDITSDITTIPRTTTEPRTTTDVRYDKVVVPEEDRIKIPLGGYLPGSGGGGGGFRGRKRRKVELFSFEMGQDTPIPTRYGLAGQTTQYVPGVRGIAANILPASDIAPNRLFDIGSRSKEDRL